jgi:Bacteriophage related domain of unknown function
MAHQQVVAAVEKRMAERWHHCPVIGQNMQAEAPQDGSPYILIQFPASRTDRLAINEGYYREEGGVRFVLHLPAGEGTARALLWANELTRLFRYVDFDGVSTQAPTSPFMDDTNDVGGWFLATIVVPYVFDFEDDDNGE